MIGSFLNVCIYRIPKGKSITYPPSHCPKCEHKLKLMDLIPILSYLLNKGKCRYCGEQISLQYPIVEVLNALCWSILYFKLGLNITFINYAILVSILIVVSFIDYHHKIIPDRLILFGLICSLVFQFFYNWKVNYLNGLIGMLIGGGIFLLIALITGAMGGGDIKLMGILGFWLGWQNIVVVTFLSFIVGAVISLFLMAFKIKGRKDFIPFGPFISIAAFITMLYGTEIIQWYISRL